MRFLIVGMVLGLLGCANSDLDRNTFPNDGNLNGFLSNYSLLEPVKVKDDSITKRYVSTQISKKEYSSIILEPVIFFPSPEKSEMLSENTLTEVSDYANSVIKSSIAESFTVVTEPGPNTLRLKVAITGVGTQNDKLATFQYIPIAFLLTAATGKLNDVVVTIQIEGELSDSMTGEPLILATKSGLGETLTNDSTPLDIDNVRPLLDSWGMTLQETLINTIRKQ